MRFLLNGLLGVALVFVTGTAMAQMPKPKALNNVEIQSKHPRAGTMVFRFEDGILNYTFIEGPRSGAGGVDLDYTARKLGDEMYLVSWHDEMYLNHFALVFDFKNKVEYTDAIMGYGTESQNVFWTESVIEKVTPIE